MKQTNITQNKKKRPKKGFTLIELLVVIAIIAILAAMLFPVFSRAKEKSKQTVCTSHMSQMGKAVLMYAGDWDDHLPLDSHATRSTEAWQYSIRPYLGAKVNVLLRCPSDLSANFEKPLPGSILKRLTTYGTNFYMTAMDPDNPSSSHGYTSFSSIASPSNTIYIAEMKTDSISDHFHPAWWYPRNPDGTYIPPEEELQMTMHGKGALYTFLDGHAKWYRFENTFSGDREIDLYDPRRSD